MPTKEKLFVPLSDDLLFKETFTHIDNRDKLIYFLSSITDFSSEYLHSVNMRVKYESVISKTKLNDKALRGDILIEFDHYKINLECYGSKFNQYSFDKSVSYVMRIFSTQMDRGNNDYKLLESVIGLNIVDNVSKDFNLSPEMISKYILINEENPQDTKLANKFIIKFYRLDKARVLSYNENNLAQKWLKFIGAKSAEERKKVAKGDKMLMELDNWIEEYVNDEKTQEIFGKWAEKIAEQNGREEGIEQVAQNLLNLNIPIEKIHLATGLTIEEIKELKK